MLSEQTSVFYCEIKSHPGYRVTRNGEVWSCRKCVRHLKREGFSGASTENWRPLKLITADKYGHLFVTLCPGRKRILVHRLVLEMFVEPCPPGMQCRHFPDHNPKNNRLENLQWGTPQQNQDDREIHKTKYQGVQCPQSKLTPELVREIRAAATGKRGECYVLARKYGITRDNIRCVIARISWKHVS